MKKGIGIVMTIGSEITVVETDYETFAKIIVELESKAERNIIIY